MAASVTASVTDLPESRVRVEAEVAPEEVQRRLESAAKAIGREMKIPGFRKGKVPLAVVIGRVGRPAILDEAVREWLGRVQATPGFMNDLEAYPANAGPGGGSAHG